MIFRRQPHGVLIPPRVVRTLAISSLGLAAIAWAAEGLRPPQPGLIQVEVGSSGAGFDVRDQGKLPAGSILWADPKSLIPGTPTLRAVSQTGESYTLSVHETKDPKKLVRDIQDCENKEITVPGASDSGTPPAPPVAPPPPSSGGGGGGAGPANPPQSGGGSPPRSGGDALTPGPGAIAPPSGYHYPFEPRRRAGSGNPLGGGSASGSLVDAVAGSASIVEQAQGIELVEAGKQIRQVVEKTARQDQEAVSVPYRSASLETIQSALERAAGNLSRSAEALGSLVGGLDASEAQRFRLNFLNAADKAAAGADAIREDRARDATLSAQSPFKGLLGPGGGNPLARTPQLRDLFGAQNKEDYQNSAMSNEGLINRMILFGGLTDDKQSQMLGKLKFAEKTQLTLKDGRSETISILHNGYIFGAGASGLDCSSFVSSLLPGDAGKMRYTTLDFLTMWSYRRTGIFPKPPTYPGPQLDKIKRASDAFTPINFYEGDRPNVGDLLVYRVPWETSGHVFLVKNFNPVTLNVEVLEASQSAGTVRERDFSMTSTPPNTIPRVIRPGLFGLRLKPTDSRACKFSDAKRGSKR